MALIWNRDYTLKKENRNRFWREISKEQFEGEDRGMFILPKEKVGKKFYQLGAEVMMLQMTMGLHIGIHKITDKNWEKVYDRVSRFEKTLTNGSLLTCTNEKGEKVNHPYTKEMIKRMIGLGASMERKAFYDEDTFTEMSDEKFNEFINQKV